MRGRSLLLWIGWQFGSLLSYLIATSVLLDQSRELRSQIAYFGPQMCKCIVVMGSLQIG